MDVFYSVKKRLMERVNKKEEITLESKLSDLTLDSFEVVDLMLLLENDFNIVFDNDELMKVTTVKDIVELINRKH